MSTRAQAWYMDFIFAMVVFSVCIILFYSFYPNMSKQENSDLEEIFLDGKLLAESLLSPGYPVNWTNATVERIGVVDNRAVNRTKFIQFSEMTVRDYYDVKSRFNLKADFVVFFTSPAGQIENISGIHHTGHPAVSAGAADSIDLSGLTYDNFVSYTRIVTLDGDVKKLVVYAWD